MGQRMGEAHPCWPVSAAISPLFPSRSFKMTANNFVFSTHRFATADEIGGFVATLLSDKMGGMGFMAGSDIVVDGGEYHAWLHCR